MPNYNYNCILKELKLITSISMILISPYIYEKNQDFHSLEKMARDCWWSFTVSYLPIANSNGNVMVLIMVNLIVK